MTAMFLSDAGRNSISLYIPKTMIHSYGSQKENNMQLAFIQLTS